MNRYAEFHKLPVFSHEELVVKAARRVTHSDPFLAGTYVSNSPSIKHALDDLRKTEFRERAMETVKRLKSVQVDSLSEEVEQCVECYRFCYLSCIVCPKHRDKPLCLPHATVKIKVFFVLILGLWLSS